MIAILGEDMAVTRYRPFSKHPFVVRDISFWFGEKKDVDELMRRIRVHYGSDGLLRTARIVDVYDYGVGEGEGEVVWGRSYTLRLVYQAMDRTLKKKELEKEVDAVEGVVSEMGGFVR